MGGGEAPPEDELPTDPDAELQGTCHGWTYACGGREIVNGQVDHWVCARSAGEPLSAP